MSEQNIIGATPDNVVGIVGATVSIGQYIVNDYVITLAPIEGDYGYTMTITRGSETQTVTLYGLSTEQYDAMLDYLEQAQTASAAAETAQEGAEDARDAAQAALNQAITYASNAATSASAAAQSAQDASDYDYQAAQARYAAVAAKEAAVAAQGAAEAAQTAAETSASIAGTSATSAATSATAAESSETSAAGNASSAAQSATNAAASASAAAQTLTSVQAEGAAQIAAIDAEGQEVLESIPVDYTELSDDVADLKSQTSPIGSGINPYGGLYPFAVVDKNGNAALTIDDNGYVHFTEKYFSVEEGKIVLKSEDNSDITAYDSNGTYDFAVSDKNGKVLFYVDRGTLNVNNIKSSNIAAIELDYANIKKNELNIKRNKPCNIDSEINMFIAYGQSWACGYDAPAITLSTRYDNLMLNIGIKNDPLNDVDQTATSFVPMVEATTTSGGTGTQITGETPVSAMCNMVKQLLSSENGYTFEDFEYQMLGNCPGMGSKSLAELSKGTIYYDRLVDQVQMAYDIATSLGKKLVVQAFSWQQGEPGQLPSGSYAQNLEQLRLDIDTDVKAITGQTQDVKCITWETFLYAANGARRFYDRYVGASETYPNIICCGASYQFNHINGSNLHLTSTSQDWAGAYFGLAYKRTIIDGTKFIPLKPVKFAIDGNAVYVTFNVPVKPIVFDTNTVSLAENYGFNILDSEGNEKAITSVSIVSPDAIKILCSSALNGTDRVCYGQNGGNSYGPVNGNRGNVRDCQGDTITYLAGDGTTLEIHNWLVSFDKPISELSQEV